MEDVSRRYWKQLVNGKVQESSRWHSSQQGMVRTADLLGDHLVAELRDAVHGGKGGRAVTRSARELLLQLKVYEDESRLLVKLADTGRVITALKRTMTTALDILHLRNSCVAGMWRQQLRGERNQRLQLYDELLGDQDRMRAELGDEEEQIEIQTLLKNGLKKYGDGLTPGELDAMSAAFDAAVRRSNLVVTVVPDWFATTETDWADAVKSSLAGGEEDCLREASVVAELQHPNVRKFYGAYHVGKEPFMIHEWTMEVGFLGFRWRKLLGCVRGVLYVHERGLVHRHLALTNLLGESPYTTTGHLSGLGLVWRSTSEDVDLKADPPELSRSNDVKALGIALFQLHAEYHIGGPGCASLVTSDASRLPVSKPNFVNDDEWRLLQGMCDEGPAARITMLDVVHEIATLAAQEDAASDTEEPRARLETVGDVRKYFISSLNETLEVVIAKAREVCTAIGTELADLHLPVFKRFVGIYCQLLELTIPPRLCLVETFALLLERWYTSLEHKASLSYSQSSVGSLCASRTIAGRNYGLHHDIDRLLQDYSEEGLDSSAAVHQWQPSWKKALQRQREALEILVEDPTPVLKRMESETERSEALSLLRSEAQNSGLRTGEMPTLPSWFIPPHLVELGKHVATGSFGAVYEGVYLDSPVVVKQVLMTGLGPEERRQITQEANLWYSLNHRNLVKLYGACHEGRPFFVCERVMGGTIVEFARKNPAYVWDTLCAASRGLQHLHDHDIVHGDLKGNNILVGNGWSDVKVADFGLSFAINHKTVATHANGGALGAFRWKAPEVLRGGKPTFESDIYSFGMCIIEAVTGQFPWGNALSDATVKHNVVEKRLLPQQPSGFSDSQWGLVRRMCCYDPAERITAGAVVGILADSRL